VVLTRLRQEGTQRDNPDHRSGSSSYCQAADPEGEAAQASIRTSEKTQSLLDPVWDQLTKI